MTYEERAIFHKQRDAYFDKCEAFNEELRLFFEHYKPRNNDQHLQTI